MVKIEIIQSRGSYNQGAVFEIDEQVARQLVAEGTARVVSRVTVDDIVTSAAKGKKASAK